MSATNAVKITPSTEIQNIKGRRHRAYLIFRIGTDRPSFVGMTTLFEAEA